MQKIQPPFDQNTKHNNLMFTLPERKFQPKITIYIDFGGNSHCLALVGEEPGWNISDEVWGRAAVDGSLTMSLEHKNNCASDTPFRRLSVQKRLLGRPDGPLDAFFLLLV